MQNKLYKLMRMRLIKINVDRRLGLISCRQDKDLNLELKRIWACPRLINTQESW